MGFLWGAEVQIWHGQCCFHNRGFSCIWFPLPNLQINAALCTCVSEGTTSEILGMILMKHFTPALVSHVVSMTDWTGIEWNWYLMLKRSTCGFDKTFIQTRRLSTSRIEAPKWRCCCSSVDPAILSATTVPWRSPGRSVYAKWWVTHGKAFLQWKELTWKKGQFCSAHQVLVATTPDNTHGEAWGLLTQELLMLRICRSAHIFLS